MKKDRCDLCDGDILWMEFKKSLCCVWCGLHYDVEGKANPGETPPYDVPVVKNSVVASARVVAKPK